MKINNVYGLVCAVRHGYSLNTVEVITRARPRGVESGQPQSGRTLLLTKVVTRQRASKRGPQLHLIGRDSAGQRRSFGKGTRVSSFTVAEPKAKSEA